MHPDDLPFVAGRAQNEAGQAIFIELDALDGFVFGQRQRVVFARAPFAGNIAIHRCLIGFLLHFLESEINKQYGACYQYQSH